MALDRCSLPTSNFLYTTYVDVDVSSLPATRPAEPLVDLGVQTVPVLIAPDRVRSTGTSCSTHHHRSGRGNNPNPRRVVDWVAESFILNSRGMIYTQITFADARRQRVYRQLLSTTCESPVMWTKGSMQRRG